MMCLPHSPTESHVTRCPTLQHNTPIGCMCWFPPCESAGFRGFPCELACCIVLLPHVSRDIQLVSPGCSLENPTNSHELLRVPARTLTLTESQVLALTPWQRDLIFVPTESPAVNIHTRIMGVPRHPATFHIYMCDHIWNSATSRSIPRDPTWDVVGSPEMRDPAGSCGTSPRTPKVCAEFCILPGCEFRVPRLRTPRNTKSADS